MALRRLLGMNPSKVSFPKGRKQWKGPCLYRNALGLAKRCSFFSVFYLFFVKRCNHLFMLLFLRFYFFLHPIEVNVVSFYL